MAEDSKAAAVEWKNKGNGFLKSQDFDEAIKCYTKVRSRVRPSSVMQGPQLVQ